RDLPVARVRTGDAKGAAARRPHHDAQTAAQSEEARRARRPTGRARRVLTSVGDHDLDEAKRVLLGVGPQACAALAPFLFVLAAEAVVGLLLELVRPNVLTAFDVT